MNNLLVITHGELASGFKNAVSMIVGENDNLKVMGLKPGVDPFEFKREINKELDSHSGAKTLIFVDILCGTPFNSLIERFKDENVQVIVGANLPMIIEAMLHIEDDFEDLWKDVLETGKQSILTKDDFLKLSNNTDEEDDI